MADATPGPEFVPAPVVTSDLMGGQRREIILLAGKDGSGKSSSIVAIAWFVQVVLNPEATFYVIDTENKFPTAMRGFGPDAPTNVVYYKCDDMNQVNKSFDHLMDRRKPGDWIAVESMARIWERAQDLGYRVVSGYDKANYLTKRREWIKQHGNKNAPVVIPKPDDYWTEVKAAHDSDFIDRMIAASSLNVVWSTTLAKPRKEDGFIKENETRKAFRVENGLDAGMDGAPRLPTYVETTILMEARGGKIYARVVRDNNSHLEQPRQEIEITGKKSFGLDFFGKFRP